MTKTYPTIEEFTQWVKEDFKCWFTRITDAQVDAYFETDEAKDRVSREYNEGIEGLKSRDITSKIFRNGCVASAAECLSLMYDGEIG